MKTNRFLVLLLLCFTAFQACKKDDPVLQAPVISALEVGSNNNKTAYPGNDLHIEAEIEAMAKIAQVKLEINPINGTGWKLSTVYTDGFADTKNAAFHKHIDVPADAAVGNYKVILQVTDQAGKTTKVESDLTLVKDPTLPSVSNLGVELENANEIHLEADINAPNKIAKIEVEVHGGTYEKNHVFTDAAMVGKTTYHLHKHIDISAAPKGHYHVHVKVTDQSGKSIEVEDHFDK